MLDKLKQYLDVNKDGQYSIKDLEAAAVKAEQAALAEAAKAKAALQAKQTTWFNAALVAGMGIAVGALSVIVFFCKH